MQIILMRHGKPKVEKKLIVNAKGYGNWIKRYNESGIDTTYSPPFTAIEHARRCSVTVCSNLPRSLGSLRMICNEKANISDTIFREMEMPHADWKSPALPVGIWSAFFRLIWLLGYSKNAEPFSSGKERARQCAERLSDLASKHNNVLFVGHGLLNRFIAQHLKKEGWMCSEKQATKYWESNIYRIPPK